MRLDWFVTDKNTLTQRIFLVEKYGQKFCGQATLASLSRHHKTWAVSDSFTRNPDSYTLVCYAIVTTYWFISELNKVTNGKIRQNLANIYQEIVPSYKWWKDMKAALTGPCFFQQLPTQLMAQWERVQKWKKPDVSIGLESRDSATELQLRLNRHK